MTRGTMLKVYIVVGGVMFNPPGYKILHIYFGEFVTVNKISEKKPWTNYR